MLTKMELPIYLDAAATTPVHPEVLEAMLPYFTQHFGNANSQHIYGQIAKKAIDDARQSIADHINVLPEEIIFTSGATEAINLAIKGYWEANRDKGNHIITVKTEHKAVLNTCAYLETLGVDVTYLDVDHYGRITDDQLRAAFRQDTILACVMHVNNETGLIQDILSFAETCAEQGIAFFTDSTQAVGHTRTNYSSPALTMACFSGHKFGGPKGIGCLVQKRGTFPIKKQGTLFTAGIIGIAKALEIPKTQSLLIAKVLPRLSKAEISWKELVPKEIRVEHIVAICLDRPAETIPELSNVIYSRGAACSSGVHEDSHVYRLLSPNCETTIRLSQA